jgi:hypothetical protein
MHLRINGAVPQLHFEIHEGSETWRRAIPNHKHCHPLTPDYKLFMAIRSYNAR